MKSYKRMTDREMLLALVSEKPGCTAQYLIDRFNEHRMVDRSRMKTIISTAKKACLIRSGDRTKAPNQDGVLCSMATYWLAEAKVEKVPEVAPKKLAEVIPLPELPIITAYGYRRGTVPTLNQAALMLVAAVNQPMEVAA
jgi:hypothetical protein